MDGARRHLALLACFDALTVVFWCVRTYVLRNRPARTPETVSNVFFTFACLLNMGNISGLLYKSTKEIALRKSMSDESELNQLLLAPGWLKMGFWIGFFYMFELWVLKAAFIAFYWGLFSRVQTRLRFLLWGTIVITAGTFVAIFVMYLAWCTPLERNWTADLVDYQACAFNPSPTAHTYQAAFNITTDGIIMLLPLSIIQSLRLGRVEKLALIFVFGIGGFSIGASAMRYAVIINALAGTYTLASLKALEQWSVVEFSLALLAFCLPAFRGMLVQWFGTGKVSTGESNPSGGLSGQGRSKRSKNFMDTRVTVGEYIDSLGTLRTKQGNDEEIELGVRSGSSSQEHLQQANASASDPSHGGVWCGPPDDHVHHSRLRS